MITYHTAEELAIEQAMRYDWGQMNDYWGPYMAHVRPIERVFVYNMPAGDFAALILTLGVFVLMCCTYDPK